MNVAPVTGKGALVLYRQEQYTERSDRKHIILDSQTDPFATSTHEPAYRH